MWSARSRATSCQNLQPPLAHEKESRHTCVKPRLTFHDAFGPPVVLVCWVPEPTSPEAAASGQAGKAGSDGHGRLELRGPCWRCLRLKWIPEHGWLFLLVFLEPPFGPFSETLRWSPLGESIFQVINVESFLKSKGKSLTRPCVAYISPAATKPAVSWWVGSTNSPCGR